MKDVEREIQSERHPLHVHATKSSRNVVQLKWRRKNMLNEADVIGRHGNNGNNKLWQEAKAQWSWALDDISNFLCDFFLYMLLARGDRSICCSLARSLPPASGIIVKIIYQCMWHKSFTVALLLALLWRGEQKEKKNCKFNGIFSRKWWIDIVGDEKCWRGRGKKSKENSLFICPCSLMSLVVVLALRIKRDDEWKIGRGKVSRWSTFKTPK